MTITIMKKIYFLFLLTILPLLASADPVAINGIYYNLDASKKVAEVTTHPDGYTGKVVIPKTVTYNSVKYSISVVTSVATVLFSIRFLFL